MKELKAGDLIQWRGQLGLVLKVQELQLEDVDALFDDGDVGYMPDWQWADLEVVSSA